MQLSITLPPKPKPPKLWRLPKRLSNRPGGTFRWLGVEDERFWGDFEGDLHARQLFTAPGRSHPLPPLLRGRERPPPPQNGRQRAQPALTEGRRGNHQRPSPLHHHHQTSPPFAQTKTTPTIGITNMTTRARTLTYPVSGWWDRNPNDNLQRSSS